MPRDGNGVYTPARDWEADAAASVAFSPEKWNEQDEDFADALNDLPLASWTPRMWPAGTAPDDEGVNPGSMMYEDGVLYICAEVETDLFFWLDVSSPGTPPSAAEATAVQIANVAHAINATGKTLGRLVVDTTNNRLMYASGSAAADPWYVADGSASVTPS